MLTFKPTYNPFKDIYIQRPLEAQILCFMCLFLPGLMYWSIYHRTIALFFGWGHSLNVCALMAIPLLFFLADPEKYLWWADLSTVTKNHRYGTILVSISVLVGWFEARVIFTRYPYLLAIPSPWNYVIVTLALYSLVGLVALVLSMFSFQQLTRIAGKLNKSGKIATITLSTASMSLLALTFGIPLWTVPIPAAMAYFGTAFVFTKSWSQYAVAVVLASIMGFFWLVKNFWFLTYEFSVTMLPLEWTIRLSHLTILMLLFFTVSFFTIPAVLQKSRASLALLITQAVLLSLIEEVLFEQGGGYYSPILVFFTSILGMVMSNSLYGSEIVSINQACVVMSRMFYFYK